MAKRKGVKRKFKPYQIDIVIAELLSDDLELEKWHKPHGGEKKPLKNKGFYMKASEEEIAVIRYVCAQWKTDMTAMFKKLIIRQYFMESGYIEDIGYVVPRDVMKRLFNYAYNKITDPKGPRYVYKPGTVK